MSFLGNLFNQINPFDHGKTFSNPNPAPQPQQAPRPQVNLNQLMQSLQSQNGTGRQAILGGFNPPNTNYMNQGPVIPQPSAGQSSINAAVQQLQNNPPKFGPLVNPQARQQFIQQLQQGNSFDPVATGIGIFGKGLYNTVINPFEKLGEATITDPARSLLATAFNNTAAKNAAEQRILNDVQQSIVGATGHMITQGLASIPTRGANSRVINVNNPALAALTGGNQVPTIQNQYRQDRASGDNPLIAGGKAAVNTAGDALAIYGLLHPAINAAKENVKPVYAAGPEPVPGDTPQVGKTGNFTDKTGYREIDRILENKDTVAGGEKVADYYRRAKGEDWKIVEMTPDEYLRRSEVAMGNDPANAGKYHMGNVEKYAADMRKGDKFDMPWINEARGTQEGRTRALAAKANGQETIKVAVAEKYTAPTPAPQVGKTDQTYYHGTTEKFGFNEIKPGTKYVVDKNNVFGNDGGFSISRSKDVAKGYGENTLEVGISPDAKIATAKDFPQVFKQFEDGKYYNMKDAVKLAQENGFDGIDIHSFELKTPKPSKSQEIQIFNKNVLVDKSTPTPQVGKTNQPKVLTTQEKSMGKALGMSDKLILEAKSKGQSDPAGLIRLSGKTAEELAQLSSKDQMTLANASMKQAPLAPKEVNTAANPLKIDIKPVAQGDYAKARSNGQLASKPVEFSGTRWQESMRKLSANEKDNFWKSVENPSASHSPAVQDAITKWNDVSNRAHATSQALGGNTNFVKDYGLHPWDKSGWTIDTPGGNGGGKFNGLNNMSRKYQTIAEGEAKGLKLGTDPVAEGNAYIRAASSRLKKEALIKGLAEADSAQIQKPHTVDFGYGKTVPLSDAGLKEAKGVVPNPKSDNALLNGYRKVNRGAKEGILSASQFHTINVGGLRAAPTLLAEGHPIAAIKGLYGMARDAFGNSSSEARMNAALKDGTVEKAVRIGMPYGASDYATTGQIIGRGGVGEHTVFGKQMPAMHDQVVRSVITDLEKKGISLDSPQARDAGLVGNKLMGFINTEVQNLDPKVQRALGDIAFAPQFTRSGFELFKDAGKKGVAGSYARRGIAANVAASTAVITGVGALLNQKSDSVRDSLLRALIDPAIATPYQDSKGNTVKLKTPGTLTSNAAKVLGIKLVRNSDGHLGVSWKPGNLPSTVIDYARSHLAVVPSVALKLKTNENYANKPLYDPNAPAGTKAQQAATTITTGILPIPLQGLVQSNAIKSHLPTGVQDVLNANKPGVNPLLGSVLSSIGATPTTDKTVGKGLQTDQYFTALNDSKSGLNSREKAAMELYSGSKKNPVTGQYDVQPNINDTRTKATALLDNPKVIDNLITMNKTLSDKGQAIDPLWRQSKDNITKVMQYQAMPPGGPDKSKWIADNKSWYTPLANARTTFFNSLPAGDAKKLPQPIEYPSATPAVATKQTQFFNLPDSKTRAEFIAANPDLQQQLDKQVEYTNQMRQGQGYSALDTFPKADPGVQKIIDTYNALPKGDGPKGGNATRSRWIQNNPVAYDAMNKYFLQTALYGAQQSLGQAQYKDTGVSQQGLKDLYNLGQYDIGKQTDANGNTIYTLGGAQSKYGNSAKSNGAKLALAKVPKVPKIKSPKAPSIKMGRTKTTKFASIKFAKPRRIKVK